MQKDIKCSLSAQVFKSERMAFLKICASVDTVRSLTCYLLATHNEWTQYLELKMPDPESSSFRDDYLVSECMRKNPRLPTGIDTKSVAFGKWMEGESLCRDTNNLLEAYSDGRISFPPAFEDLLTKTRSIIASVLGKLDRSKLNYCEANFRFGPGATDTCSGRFVIPSRKMVSSASLTPRLYPYWRSILGRGIWRSSVNDISLSHGSRLTFVPKDAKTDRPICIEPHINIFVQLGIGALIRQRLKGAGLDLDLQAEHNRALAMKAQRYGLATIDLSSASDTIARELVWLLLPPDWAALLDLARSEYVEYSANGEIVQHRLEKFSSMGNGYTFELETLIFWALARASGDENAVAFGDDIIVQKDVALELIGALNRLGFKVNERKTFLAGRFFESCGVDVHNGINVRPFYFRKEVRDTITHFTRIANAIRLYAHRRNCSLGCDIRFLPAWIYIIHRDKRVLETGIPPGYGDDGLIRNFDECAPSKARKGYEGWVCKTYRRNPERSKYSSLLGSYLASLAFGSPGDVRITVKPDKNFPGDQKVRCHWRSRTHEDVRGKTSKPAPCTLLVPRWVDLGPWC